MSGEINDWSWWIHPRSAVADVMAALGCSHETAVAAIVRRLIAGKIVAVTGEYRGPRDNENHLRPDLFRELMALWRGLWMNDVFRASDSPIWSVGDLEGSISGEVCFFFNVRLRRSDLEVMLSECGGISANDNEARPEPALDVTPITRVIEPKWAWDKTLAALVAVADGKDGLEGVPGYAGAAQRGSGAALEKWLAEYFSALNPQGQCPSDSELRRRAKYVLDAVSAREAPPN